MGCQYEYWGNVSKTNNKETIPHLNVHQLEYWMCHSHEMFTRTLLPFLIHLLWIYNPPKQSKLSVRPTGGTFYYFCERTFLNQQKQRVDYDFFWYTLHHILCTTSLASHLSMNLKCKASVSTICKESFQEFAQLPLKHVQCVSKLANYLYASLLPLNRLIIKLSDPDNYSTCRIKPNPKNNMSENID